jgi:predicted TIM-barrel fold metal-dependent hydrolase
MSDGRLRILIVDDSADTTPMLRVLLGHAGHAARIGSNGPTG